MWESVKPKAFISDLFTDCRMTMLIIIIIVVVIIITSCVIMLSCCFSCVDVDSAVANTIKQLSVSVCNVRHTV